MYGWGIYFAQNPAVAKEYQKKLSGFKLLLDGEPIDYESLDKYAQFAFSEIEEKVEDVEKVEKEKKSEEIVDDEKPSSKPTEEKK